MEKSNVEQFIGDSVYLINQHYTELQSKTKVIYFRCLEQERDIDYFNKQVEKLWKDIDHSFMDKQIAKLNELVHDTNIELAVEYKVIDGKEKLVITTNTKEYKTKDYFKLTPESDFRKVEEKYLQRLESNYKKSLNSIKKQDKETYIQKKLASYDEEINQVVAYYNSKGGGIQRYVQVSTYLSMLHNVDLTRSGWNTTIKDAIYLNAQWFIIPYHNFSCEHCRLYQNRPLSRAEVENVLGLEAKEQVGDILHPNCKCTLSIYWDSSQVEDIKWTNEEQDEFYKIRQQVNHYSLQLDKLITDKRIIDKYGTQKQKDTINKKISDVSKKSIDLVNMLPTTELKRQVEAINR